jgi:hypothetical protein
MDGVRKRITLGLVCLVIAPPLGLWAGGSMPNPPGNGPGAGQVVVGVAVPLLLTLVAARVARIRSFETGAWAVASLALTGALVLLLIWFVQTYVPT